MDFRLVRYDRVIRARGEVPVSIGFTVLSIL